MGSVQVNDTPESAAAAAGEARTDMYSQFIAHARIVHNKRRADGMVHSGQRLFERFAGISSETTRWEVDLKTGTIHVLQVGDYSRDAFLVEEYRVLPFSGRIERAWTGTPVNKKGVDFLSASTRKPKRPSSCSVVPSRSIGCVANNFDESCVFAWDDRQWTESRRASLKHIMLGSNKIPKVFRIADGSACNSAAKGRCDNCSIWAKLGSPGESCKDHPVSGPNECPDICKISGCGGTAADGAGRGLNQDDGVLSIQHVAAMNLEEIVAPRLCDDCANFGCVSTEIFDEIGMSKTRTACPGDELHARLPVQYIRSLMPTVSAFFRTVPRSEFGRIWLDRESARWRDEISACAGRASAPEGSQSCTTKV